MLHNLLFITILGLVVASACTGLDYDPPETELVIEVAIESPQDGSTLSNPVVLSTRAVDEIGGDIGFLTEWSSDIDGILGTGAMLEVSLSPGEHMITAEIDDGRGRYDQDSVVIQVE